MVDLFNVMEQESKNQMNYSPQNDIQGQIDKRQKLYNLMQYNETLNQINEKAIDPNMWRHFQNLLKKNQSNPYL
jgi:hypothetical protein